MKRRGGSGLFFGAFAAVLPFTLSGCHFPWAYDPGVPRSADPTRGSSDGLPFPSKDEVLLVDGRAFSLTAFYRVRSSLRKPELQKKSSVIWTGVAILLIERNAARRGGAISSSDALLIARYAQNDLEDDLNNAELQTIQRTLTAAMGPHPSALSPSEVHAKIDAWAQQVTVEKNAQLLSELP